jgi:hypothetical protein
MMWGLLSLLWEWISKSRTAKIVVGKMALRFVLFMNGFQFKRRGLVVDELIRIADDSGGLLLNEMSFGLGIMLTDKKVRILALRKYAFWGPVTEYKIKSLFFPPCKFTREQLTDWLTEYVRRAEVLKSFGLRRQVAPLLNAPK